MKIIPGTNKKYSATKDGRIYSHYSNEYLSQCPNGKYLSVNITVHKKETRPSAHRLVAKAFIPNPDNLPEVNHKDGNKKNNCVSNLEWSDRKRQAEHAYETGLIKNKGRKVYQLDMDGEVLDQFSNMGEASNATGAHRNTISLVCHGKLKTSGGYKWRFVDEYIPVNVNIDSLKELPGYLSYYVSSDGFVYSDKTSRILNPNISDHGYHFVRPCKNGKAKRMSIHRCVALTYIPNPDNKPKINHKNGIKSDNRVENLEWATASEDTQHAMDTGLYKGKKAVIRYDLKGNELNRYTCAAEAERDTDVSATKIAAVCRGKRQFTGGFVWRYQTDPLAESPNVKLAERPIARLNKKGEITKRYDSIAKANEDLGKPRKNSNISEMLRGKSKTAYGYKWKYLD